MNRLIGVLVALGVSGCASDFAVMPVTASAVAATDGGSDAGGDVAIDASREHYELAAAAVAGATCDEAVVRGTCTSEGRIVCQGGVYVQFPPCPTGWLCTMRQIGDDYQVISQCVSATAAP